LRDKLSASDVRERLYLVDLGEHKDTSGLYLAGQANFRQRFMAALDDATPLIELRRTEAETAARAAWEACAELAQKSDILSSFAIELARCGVAGETRFAKLLYLCVTLWCLTMGSVTSYARARAESLGMDAKGGLAERADRLVAILVMTGFGALFGLPILMEVTLWVLAVASTYTVGFRVLKVRRQAIALDAAENGRTASDS
jgi:CDP-diacylglycerol---glycerol-3-phosphate 3-phosphatidyltransferase